MAVTNNRQRLSYTVPAALPIIIKRFTKNFLRQNGNLATVVAGVYVTYLYGVLRVAKASQHLK